MPSVLSKFLQASLSAAPPDTLDLEADFIGDEGLRALAESPYLASLRDLCLVWNQITDEGVGALASSPYLRHLQILNLACNPIADEGAAALARSPHLASLQQLHLRWNNITDEGVRALARSSHLRNLRLLDLWQNQITDEGAVALAQSPYLASVERLVLSYNLIEQRGEDALAKREVIKASPAPAFQHESDPPWRLFAYACLSDEAKTSVQPEFLTTARALLEAVPTAHGWLWCLAHLRTWTGDALFRAADAFPEVPELQERKHVLLSRQRSLEAALYEPR